MKMNIKLILLVVLFVPFQLFAQQLRSITGTVTDTDGEPLIGAVIKVKGAAIGTTTNSEGNFTIKCNDEAVVEVSYIGMETKAIAVKKKEFLTITLNNSIVQLDEVVATGYGGKMKKKDIIGSTSSISSADLKDLPVADIAQALSGRISGLQVAQSSGGLDSEIYIRLRGGTSITQDNSPLIIIDGVPSLSGLTGIAPSDIETIDVLKDASTTAIYGSRGANGVILVTTKGAKPGKTSVTYEGFFGYKEISSRLDMLDARQYVKLEFERNGFSMIDETAKKYGSLNDIDANYPIGSGIDWQDQLFGKGATNQMHRINITGGDKSTNYTLSITNNNENGVFIKSGLIRNTARLGLNSTLSKNFKVNTSISYSKQDITGSGSLEDTKSMLGTAMSYRPTGGYKVSDKDFVGQPIDEDAFKAIGEPYIYTNPLINILTEDKHRLNTIMTASFGADYKISKSLSYKGNISYSYKDNTTKTFYDSNNPKSVRSGGAFGSIGHIYSGSTVYNNTITYKPALSTKHSFDMLFGQETLYNTSNSESFGGNYFPETNFGLNDFSLAKEGVIPSTLGDSDIQYSFFSRLNYQFKSRYILSSSLRADGSSKFGANNKWGLFPSVALGWRLIEEKFIKDLNVFSNLKLRASYGITGNNRIPNYASLSLFDVGRVTYNNSVGSYFAKLNMANPNLRWEKNITTNLGLDFGFYKNRILVSLEAYKNITQDLLMASQVPYTSGYETILKNIGATENKGVEVEINTVNVNVKNFSWKSSFNISFNKNVVKALADADFLEASTSNGTTFIVKVGQPLGLMYGYQYDGVYNVDDFNYNSAGTTDKTRWVLKPGIAYDKDAIVLPGTPKYKNTDNDPDNLITINDRTVIGYAQPIFFGGFNNSFKIYDFDMSFFVNFNYGNDIYNAIRQNKSIFSNQFSSGFSKAYEERFVIMAADGTNLLLNPDLLRSVNEGVKSPSINGSAGIKNSDTFVEDGSFLRLNTVSVGYTIPARTLKKMHLTNCRIYSTISNPFVLTKYSGYDPEVNSKASSITPGVDWGAQPRSKSIVVGISLTI